MYSKRKTKKGTLRVLKDSGIHAVRETLAKYRVYPAT